MTRQEIRDLAIRFRLAAVDRYADALVDVRAKDADAAADVLSTPTWFTPAELRLAADAMDILGYSTADGWTLRQRLDAFWTNGPLVKNAGSFAAYLHNLPNGGIQ